MFPYLRPQPDQLFEFGVNPVCVDGIFPVLFRSIEQGKDISLAQPHKLTLEFESIAIRCMAELEATEKEGVRVQWMKMILDCARYAKEEMRLLDGMGATSEYTFTVNAPPPQAIPAIDVDAEDEERVLN